MANWKIKRIEVENFKFFKSRFILDIDCKNLLLYGENGAGKSSLYWSFYTHFQASTKTEDQAKPAPISVSPAFGIAVVLFIVANITLGIWYRPFIHIIEMGISLLQ